jgi:predicted nucleotide-binding protein
MALEEKKFTALLMKVRDASRRTIIPSIHDLFSYVAAETRSNRVILRYEEDRKTKWASWGHSRMLGDWEMPLDESDRKSLAYHLYQGIVESGDAGNGTLHWMYHDSFEANFLDFQRDFFDVLVSAMEDVYNAQERLSDSSHVAPKNEKGATMPDSKKVFIIHGRNVDARGQMGIFVRSLGLVPINFADLRASLGGTPTIADIVESGMNQAQGVIALITADEYAAVRPDYRYAHDQPDDVARLQARPNVIFEAGMAFGKDRKRVVFVLLGNPKLFTDVAGIHVLRPTNDPSGDRAVLRSTLWQGMGCEVEPHSTDWMKAGDFESSVKPLPGVSPRDPFRD